MHYSFSSVGKSIRAESGIGRFNNGLRFFPFIYISSFLSFISFTYLTLVLKRRILVVKLGEEKV